MLKVEEADERPWERPGQVRRDALPHRAGLLDTLATASLLCGVSSICLVFPALVGLPLGVVTWLLARRELQDIEAGLVDPRGRERIADAKDWAFKGTLLCLVVLVVDGLLLVWLNPYGVVWGPEWP
jgi:hypothetical protein